MIYRKTVSRSLVLWLVILGNWYCCAGEKLSPNQKAPQFARGSGGLILNTPFDDNKARKSPVPSGNAVDEVQREETEMLKLVDGELVRTVEGSFAYKSPEGLPISVKYMADENGNRASFKFGTGEAGGIGGGGSSTRPGQKSDGNRGGQTRSGAQGSKGSTYLPPNDANRSYLPPK